MKKLITTVLLCTWLIFLSNNAIGQWEKIYKLPYRAHCMDMQMAPDSSFWLLLGCYNEQYVLKSIDKGKSWLYYKLPYYAIGQYNVNNIQCISPIDSLTAYVAIFKKGLIKTIDGGKSWQLINNKLANIFSMYFFNLNEGIAFDSYLSTYGTYSNGDTTGVYKTFDGGSTWQKINLASIGGLLTKESFLNIGNNNGLGVAHDTLIVSTSCGRLLISDDRGNNWKAIYSGLGKEELLVGVSLKNSKIFSTISQVSTGFNQYGRYTRIQISTTTDGGTTWINNKCTPFDVVIAPFIPNTPGTILLCNYKDYIGTMISYDNGENFSVIDLHHNFTNCKFFSSDLGFAITKEGADEFSILKWTNKYEIIDPFPQFKSGTEVIDTFYSGYRFYIPENMDVNKKYPLTLVLHCHGLEGCDNMKQLIQDKSAVKFYSADIQQKYPGYLLIPQKTICIDTSSIHQLMYYKIINKIIDSLIVQNPQIDTNRIYITGFSMGGYNTWDLLRMYPHRFAAAVPMGGGFQDAPVESILHVPMWDFQGETDDVVKHEWAEKLMDKFISCGRQMVATHNFYRKKINLPDSIILTQINSNHDLFFTLFTGIGHDPSNMLSYKKMYDWLYKQYKQVPNSIKFNEFDEKYTGTMNISWNSSFSNDKVEIWYSPDNGYYWKLIASDLPNNGNYSWNTVNESDCGAGRIKILLKNSEGFVFGCDKSSLFKIDNSTNSKPYIAINDSITERKTSINRETLDLRPVISDAENDLLSASVYYREKNGSYQLLKEYSVTSSFEKQACEIKLSELPCKSISLKLEVTDGMNTVADSTLYFNNINCATEISDKKLNTLQLYPNPTSSLIHIVIPQHAKTADRLELFDYTGRLVYSQTISNVDKGESIKLDLSDKAQGMYILKIQSGNQSYCEKLMLVK